MRLTLRRKLSTPAQASPPVQGARARAPRTMGLLRWLGMPVRIADGLLHRRTVAISMDSDAVRVVVLRRTEVVAWGMASPEAARDAPGAEIDGQQRLAVLRTLLDRLNVRHGRVVLDLPLYAPLERHIRLSKTPRRHLESVVLSETLESIPFTRGEVDIAWQAKKNGAGLEASATAVAKATTDGLVRSLREVGVRPAAIYSKAVALARAAGVPDVIVVRLARDAVSVALVRDHLPCIVHQETLPERGDPRTVAEQVARGVEQVADCRQGVDAVAGDAPLPVFLVGRLGGQRPLLEELRGLLRREVLPVVIPLHCPDGFPVEEYAVNLGLVLADRSRAGARRLASRRHWQPISLLPERHIRVRVPVGRVACLVSLALLAIAGINATAKVDEVVGKAAVLSARVSQLQQQDRQYRVALATVNDAEQNDRKTEQFAADLEVNLAGLRDDVLGLVGRLDAFTGSAADTGVQLVSVVPVGSGFAVAGIALTHEDALEYTTALRRSGHFSDVALSRMESSTFEGLSGMEGQFVSFQVKASMASGADGGNVAHR